MNDKKEVEFDKIRIELGRHVARLIDTYKVNYKDAQNINDMAYEMSKVAKDNTFTIVPCRDSEFKDIPCLEDKEQYGFFRVMHDVRPSNAIWIKKEDAEHLFELFRKANTEGTE